jgi:hypothetical protein
MDELTRRIRELMKPIENRPPIDVEDDATEEQKKVLKHLGNALRRLLGGS